MNNEVHNTSERMERLERVAKDVVAHRKTPVKAGFELTANYVDNRIELKLSASAKRMAIGPDMQMAMAAKLRKCVEWIITKRAEDKLPAIDSTPVQSPWAVDVDKIGAVVTEFPAVTSGAYLTPAQALEVADLWARASKFILNGGLRRIPNVN